MNSISPLDLWPARHTKSKIYIDASHTVDTNTANSTLLDTKKAQNSQVITTEPVNLTKHGKIDGNPQLTPIVSNNSMDTHNVLIDSETSSGNNALEAIIYNETMGDVLADPKIDPSLKAELDTTKIFIGTLKSWHHPSETELKLQLIPVMLKLV